MNVSKTELFDCVASIHIYYNAGRNLKHYGIRVLHEQGLLS